MIKKIIEMPKEIKEILAQDTLRRYCRNHRDKYIRMRDTDGYMKTEHLIVWERHHGKKPLGAVIHHINGDKTDNRIENLSLFPNSASHMNHHKQTNKLFRERNNLFKK